MASETVNLDLLSEQDRALLEELLEACEAQHAFMDAKLFRKDHYVHIDAMDLLERQGYLRKERLEEKEFYQVSLMAMVQMPQCQVAKDILTTAESLWQAFRNHYLKSTDQPIDLQTVADLLGLERGWVRRVHVYMREWWVTPIVCSPMNSPEQMVIVQEAVLKKPCFADCVLELRKIQKKQILSLDRVNPAFGVMPVDQVHPQSSKAIRFPQPARPSELPGQLQVLLDEIYMAMNNDLLALPAMGIRAVIDTTCNAVLNKDLQSFNEKLNALKAMGHLSNGGHLVLGAAVEVGHAAMHRAHVPDLTTVQSMLAALEHMLYSVYGSPKSAELLTANTPQRPQRTK